MRPTSKKLRAYFFRTNNQLLKNRKCLRDSAKRLEKRSRHTLSLTDRVLELLGLFLVHVPQVDVQVGVGAERLGAARLGTLERPLPRVQHDVLHQLLLPGGHKRSDTVTEGRDGHTLDGQTAVDGH